jgi:hypothetical protein
MVRIGLFKRLYVSESYINKLLSGWDQDLANRYWWWDLQAVARQV